MNNPFPQRPPMAHRIQIPRPYVPSYATDIRATFERERMRLAIQQRATVKGSVR